MANEDQYYSPIIQAMMHTAQLQKQGAQQEIEKQRNADEKKLREQQLKQAQQQIDQAHEHQLKQHDIAEQTLQIHRQQADMEAELNRFHAMKAAQEVLSGAKPGFQLPPGLAKTLQGGGQQFQPQQSRQLPVELGGDQQQPTEIPQTAPQADLSGLFDPQAAVRKEADLLKTKLATTQPFQIAQEQRELADKKDIEKYRATLEKTDKQLDRESHERIARITAASRVKDPTINPNTFASLFKLKALGEIKLNPTNPTHMAVLSALEENGFNADVSDKDVDAIKETAKLPAIFDQLEEFSKKLPEGRGGALLQKGQTKLTEAVGGSSDILNDWKIARSRAILIGRALEGMTGRPLAIQLKTDLDSLPEVGITKGDAQKRIANLKVLLDGVRESLTAGMPDAQKKMFLDKYQPKAAAPKKSYERTAVGDKGHRIGLSGGKWYDVETGVEVK